MRRPLKWIEAALPPAARKITERVVGWIPNGIVYKTVFEGITLHLSPRIYVNEAADWSSLRRYIGAICRDRKLKHIPPCANRHYDSLILSIGRYHRWIYTSPKIQGITRATSYPGKFLKCASRARYALPISVNATKSFKSNRLLSAISPTFRLGLLRMSPRARSLLNSSRRLCRPT